MVALASPAICTLSTEHVNETPVALVVAVNVNGLPSSQAGVPVTAAVINPDTSTTFGSRRDSHSMYSQLQARKGQHTQQWLNKVLTEPLRSTISKPTICETSYRLST